MKAIYVFILLGVFQSIQAKSFLSELFDSDEEDVKDSIRSHRRFSNDLSFGEKSKLKDMLLEELKNELVENDDLSAIDNDNDKSEKISKRGFFSKHHDIKIYYDIVKLKNGMVILVPKDKNKNHYFIG